MELRARLHYDTVRWGNLMKFEESRRCNAINVWMPGTAVYVNQVNQAKVRSGQVRSGQVRFGISRMRFRFRLKALIEY